MLFKKKNLTLQETLGEYFRKVRLGKNWDYKEASAKTSISIHYLEAIENNEYFKIPGEIYLKNFIKKYATCLGISKGKTLNRYQEEKKLLLLQKSSSLKEIKQNSFWHYLLSPKFLKLFFINLFIGLLFFYLSLSLYHFISPPFLKIYFPADNLISNSKVIMVMGKTESESNVKINNKDILIKDDGSFTEEINLKEGLNLIVITAKRKYGRENKIFRSVLVKETMAKVQTKTTILYD